MAACPRCGEANPDRARFCLACGAPLGERSAPREMRKTVTIVFSDVIDSTPLGERLDAETYRHVISRYFIEVSRVLEHHGGTVEKFIGDAVMAVFGIPILHEDDALRAVRAAAELREALAQLNEELQRQYGFELGMRTGINTGEVVAGDPTEGHAFATGEAVALAQRLEAAASPGEILLGEKTYRLVRDAILVEPTRAARAEGSSSSTGERLASARCRHRGPGLARRLDSPMIGREDELGRLREVFEEPFAPQTCRARDRARPGGDRQVAADERVAGGHTRRGQCASRPLPALRRGHHLLAAARTRPGRGARASQEAIENLLEGEPEAERIAAQIAGAIGLREMSASPEETMWAVRRLLEHLAREQPLDRQLRRPPVGRADLPRPDRVPLRLGARRADAHRLPRAAGAARPPPCLDRPRRCDRRSTRSPSCKRKSFSSTSAARRKWERMLSRITRAAEGNPLFVEQMLAHAHRERHDLGRPGDPAHDPRPARSTPRSACTRRARRDRAGLGDRQGVLADRHRGALFRSRTGRRRRQPDDARPQGADRAGSVDLHLRGRVQFRHILIRDAAYLGIPKETRAELHERYADWLEETVGDRSKELDEIIGYHLEQSHGYREELGPVAEGAGLLATRGGERLAEAGVRALRRGDTSAAASLISRAVKLLPVDHPRRPELLTELASTLMRSGDFDRAAPVLDEAFESAVAIGDRRVELRTTIEREFFRTFTAPEGSALEDSSVADRTIPLLEELGDDRGLARAWLLKSEPEVNACRWGARAEALERALEHARRAGDTAEVAGMTFMHVQALYYGRTPVSEAIARCDEYLEEYPGDRLLEASVGTVLAGLRAMQGDFDEARSMYSRARAIHEELGRHFRIATVASLIGADIEQLAGQQSEAVAVLQWAYDTVREMGAMSATATLAGFLAEALAVDGRNAEAIEISEFADEHAPPSDIVTQALWRMARARGLAEKDRTAAEELAQRALALTSETDYPDLEGRALTCLAHVTGPGAEQAGLLAEARTLYEAKGNHAAAARLPASSAAQS